ncbi:MAG: 4Fe-4S binding protein [Clostridia bacterium]|nr:4Fe-4S binding protein [Clostridia bacterium]
MMRKIIHIDEEKCNGCGVCATACHEGAIEMVNGKAKLTREDYCDGFGDCLPGCPMDAIHFEEREAPAYNAEAVQAAKAAKAQPASGCPGAQARTFHRAEGGCPGSRAREIARKAGEEPAPFAAQSRLTTWPVQIKLAPVHAPCYENAHLLIAADCTAYAYARFHEDFIKNRVVLVGCPKLDAVNYAEKLSEIIAQNDIRSVTIVRMEVPCCGGLEYAAKTALQNSGKFLPWRVATISVDGRILED